MTNKNKYLEDLSKKLSAEKFRDELNKAVNMVKKSYTISSSGGKWVTINGNHVLIKD